VRARVVVDAGGCWLFAGATSAKGYGAVRVGDRTLGAHRVIFEAVHGPVPPGLYVDHLCSVRHCVNPDHLEAVTPAENNRRSRARRAVFLVGATGCTPPPIRDFSPDPGRTPAM
jgi:hypothetical protein